MKYLPLMFSIFSVIVSGYAVIVATREHNRLYEESPLSKKVKKFFVKSRGAIYEPPSEVDEQRQAIIDENKAQGKDTRLSDLIPSDENNS